MSTVSTRPLTKPIYWGLLLIIALMPMHALLTTWAGATFGHRELWQAWKEILLIAMAMLAVVALAGDRHLRKSILGYTPNRLIAIYAALHLGLIVITRPSAVNALFGLKSNLSFLLLFVAAQVAVFYLRSRQVNRQLVLIIIGGGLVVGLFGLAQVTILPVDVLRHFGYGPSTVVPFIKLSGGGFVRILSTLGGPNQLGQYLILPLSLLIGWSFKRRQWWPLALMIPLLITLYFSYSRSAWIGLAAAVIMMVARMLSAKYLLFIVLGALLVGSGIIGLANHDANSRSVFLHSGSDSNSDHVKAIKRSLAAVTSNLLGYGPGTAGPASLRDRTRTGFIGENYYLQLAIEVGVVGLIIFGLISVLVGWDLWRMAGQSELAMALVGTLVGVSVINLFLHGWSDSTIALVRWGSAGALVRNRS